MPVLIHQIQQVLDKYNKQLRTRSGNSRSKNRSELASDVVSISTEGKRRELLDRIGDDAVRSYKQQSYKGLKTAE